MLETGIARSDYTIEGGYSYDFILTGGLLMCPRLALLRHKEEAHYGKQSGHPGDYKHMWARGTIKVSFGTWRIFKNLEQTNTPTIYHPQFLISAPIVVCQSKTNHESMESTRESSSRPAPPPLYITLSCLSFCLPHKKFNYKEACDLPLPIFLIASAGWPPADFRSRSIIRASARLQIRSDAPPNPHGAAETLSKWGGG